MADVSGKSQTFRRAIATGKIIVSPAAFEHIKNHMPHIDISILNHVRTRDLFINYEKYTITNIPYCGKPNLKLLNIFLSENSLSPSFSYFDHKNTIIFNDHYIEHNEEENHNEKEQNIDEQNIDEQQIDEKQIDEKHIDEKHNNNTENCDYMEMEVEVEIDIEVEI